LRLLIKNTLILPMTTPEPTIMQGDILIEDERLVSVGPSLPETMADRVLDGSGKLAMPGLINCHNHAAMTFFRAYSDDLRLWDWLRDRIWPAEARMTGEDVYWGTLLAAAEMIKSGTTTFADMYVYMEDAARAVTEAGIRGVLARGMVYEEGLVQQKLRETRELFERWHGGAGGRITVMAGPHAPFTCPPDFIKETLTLAGQLGAGIHIHISETTEEVDHMFQHYGQSPVRYLYDLGLFDHHVLAAHCVNMSRDDLQLFRSMRGGIAHNPVSNCKLGCGVAPILALRELGVNVGLGTDGAGSASTLDMFQEMKAAAWLQKNQTGDPTALTAYEVLKMATITGARVLGLEEQVGSLAPGKQADVILIDLEQPHLYPRHDLTSLLAYAASGADVQTVICAGEVVMANRQLRLIDEKQILRESHARAQRIVAAV
jgi:5-methylthioadenosine/S-adenosylhomocysteine deaminase